MIWNYFTTAVRNLASNRLYSMINIGGLAMGLAACILILLFVRDELSYDDWIPEGERIFKLELTVPVPGRDPLTIGQIPPAVAPAMARYFPDHIEQATRVLQEDGVVGGNDRYFSERISFVDAEFFQVFDLDMIAGNRDAIATSPRDVLINESLAIKFFGQTDPLEQVLTAALHNPFGNDIDPNIEFRVAGVFKDIPQNSHLPFQILALIDPVRFPGINEGFGGAWLEAGYLKLKPGVDPVELESRFSDFYQNSAPPRGDESETFDYRTDRRFNLINVRDVYLFSDKIQQLKPISDINTVISFSIAAALILLIATINFMNLTTARALRRAKEVSLRKILGASRRQLVKQFLGEAILTALISLAVAVVLVELALPFFNDYLGKEMLLGMVSDPVLLAYLLLVAVGAGVLGGVYPAFFLSSYRPAQVMASSTSANKGSPFMRQALVIFQFAISIALIVSTAIVYQQTGHLRDMDLGFERQHRLAITGLTNQQVSPLVDGMRQELLALPGVTAVASSSDELPLVYYNSLSMLVPSLGVTEPIDTDRMYIDEHFLQLLNVKPIAGRLFAAEFNADTLVRTEQAGEPWTRSAIVTESFVRSAGLASAADLIGTTLVVPDYGNEGAPLHTTVVGVIPDLHLRALRERMAEMVFFRTEAVLDVLTLSIESNNLPETINAIDATWNRLLPQVPIRRLFLDEQYQSLYDAEQRRSEVFAVFAGFAIVLACLGLFGLAAYAAEQRKFEIGIRKVLGAGVTDILALTSFDFLKSVLWANLLAWPVAYLVMRNWLDRYEYRIEIDPLLFLGCGAAALLLAWLTVGWHALKAARRNPIQSLRYQ